MDLKANINKWAETFKAGLKKIKQNRDLLVFLMFLVLATFLWFLNALRKEYTTTISYPVKYVEFPDDYILLGKPQRKLQLKIKSLGYTVLPYHMGKILTPELLNVSEFKRMRNGNHNGAFVPTRELIKNFSDKLANGVELVEIYPDTLFVHFEKKQRKVVPVQFNSSLRFEQQFYQSGEIAIKPDSVEVSGPASIIDSILFVSTEFSEYEGLNDSLVKNVNIARQNHVHFNPAKVEVCVPIEPFTQKKIKVPIQHVNVPDSLSLKSFPGEVNVSFTVAVSQFNHISSEDFVAEVDYNSKTSNHLPDRLKVKLHSYTKGIKNVNYSPLFVECLFEKINSND
ncbi:hypothetical protein E9993_15165 [Labilibacter sediminis]|nr:hypothetical protein E9993_15165 [Labilibacter sediminis]